MQNDSQPDSLTITWFGHACFLLTGSDDNITLLDPMLPGMGYDLPNFDAVAAVLVTHNHRDHNYVQAAPHTITLGKSDLIPGQKKIVVMSYR